MTFPEILPSVNAALNFASACLLGAGYVAVKRGARDTHRALLLTACATSVLFLVGYFTRIALTGTHRFPGEGALKDAYLALLLSHTLLAAVAGVLVPRALFLAWKGRYEAHRKIARYAFPVWMYVSVTGVVVYVMLYHVAPRVG